MIFSGSRKTCSPIYFLGGILMRSFIPWIGGKSQLAKLIISEFPNNFERYIEVFGGGASVLFASNKHAPMEVYNDANGQLVNLF